MGTIQFFDVSRHKATEPIHIDGSRSIIMWVAKLYTETDSKNEPRIALYHSDDGIEISLYRIDWELGKFSVRYTSI